MDLGTMLAEALDQQGFAPPNGSGTAGEALQAAAEAFLAKVREAERTAADSTDEGVVPPFTMDM